MEEKKDSNLKEMTMEEKWKFLTIIYLSDIRQLRLTMIIEDEWLHSTNRYGENIKYKKYWIKEK